ncbi:MAG: hypothetical protein IT225_07140 [Flavobacteriales bacterium]|nr:hypothetical protein [Flavobacteriales bacterium]
MSSSTSNSEPLALLGRALVGGCLVAAVLLLAFGNGHHASVIDYHGAVAAKERRLRALPSPKVVIIGGSNATFGIDSERLEHALCMPVVNMTIHANLGVEFMVNEVKSRLGPGDLVIASFEYSAYREAVRDNEVHVLTVDRAPEAIHALPWYRRPRVIINVAILRLQAAWEEVLGERKGAGKEKVYRAEGFNERGDMVAHLDLPPRGPDEQQPVEYKEPPFGDDLLPLAQELVDSAAAHQARVIFTWPCIARSSRRPVVENEVAARMAEAGHPLLGEARDYVFPDTAFHDTHYHLRAVGRRLRTDQLIRDLCGKAGINCCGAE